MAVETDFDTNSKDKDAIYDIAFLFLEF